MLSTKIKMILEKSKIVYLLPGIGTETYRAVQAGEAPRERLFGAVQLIERGWSVTLCDAQWEGWATPIRRKLARWLELPAYKTCLALWQADIAVIQGRLAPLLLLVSKLFGTRVVYVDVMFDIPKHRLRQWINKQCLKASDTIICYSATQSNIWAKTYDIPINKIISAHFPMDSNFYRKPSVEKVAPPFVIAVGRDIGRDFSTLLRAAKLAGIDTKLVTLPYLLPKLWNEDGGVEAFQRVSYPKLFDLYAQSKLAAVPLKAEISYPSGIRASLEAMLLRIPVVATYTSVLAEEFVDEEHLLYVESDNPILLAKAMKRILNDPYLAERLVETAWQKVHSDFSLDQFADIIESSLVRLSKTG